MLSITNYSLKHYNSHSDQIKDDTYLLLLFYVTGTNKYIYLHSPLVILMWTMSLCMCCQLCGVAIWHLRNGPNPICEWL